MVEAMAEYCSIAKFKKDQTFYPDEGSTINVLMRGEVKVCSQPASEPEPSAADHSSTTIKRKPSLRCNHLCTLRSGGIFGESCALLLTLTIPHSMSFRTAFLSL